MIITLQEILYLLSKLPESTMENFTYFIDQDILIKDHPQYDYIKNQLQEKVDYFNKHSETVRKQKLYQTFDSSFELIDLDEQILKNLFKDVYTEMSGHDLPIPDEVKFVWLALIQHCEEIVRYHYYLTLEQFRLEFLPHTDIMDFVIHSRNDFQNVLQVQSENYNLNFYKRYRIARVNVENPNERYVLENIDKSIKKTPSHLTFYSDTFYETLDYDALIMRTSYIPDNNMGVDSNYVISHKLHNLNYSTLMFNDPQLSFWHFKPNMVKNYNTLEWDPVFSDWTERVIEKKFFIQSWLPLEYYTIVLDSLLQSNSPQFSNHSNLNARSVQLLEFWDNQRTQVSLHYSKELSSHANKLYFDIHRNQCFKFRINGAHFFEQICQILIKNRNALSFKFK